jgi:hypothetical protein
MAVNSKEGKRHQQPPILAPTTRKAKSNKRREGKKEGKMRQLAMILDVSLTKALSCKLHTPVP